LRQHRLQRGNRLLRRLVLRQLVLQRVQLLRLLVQLVGVGVHRGLVVVDVLLDALPLARAGRAAEQRLVGAELLLVLGLCQLQVVVRVRRDLDLRLVLRGEVVVRVHRLADRLVRRAADGQLRLIVPERRDRGPLVALVGAQLGLGLADRG
jgi:hypothetical protein